MVGNGASNGDVDYFGKQFDQISNRVGKREALTSQWPFDSKPPTARTPNGVPEREQRTEILVDQKIQAGSSLALLECQR